MNRGRGLANISTATVHTVAAGVIGVACIQLLLTGQALILASFPLTGLLSMVVLILGIA